MESGRQTRKRNNSILNYFQKIKIDLQESDSPSSPEIKKKRKEDSDFSIKDVIQKHD